MLNQHLDIAISPLTEQHRQQRTTTNMSSISSVSVSPLAYKKVVLHTAKYPTARVLGFLLADPSTASQGITVSDVIPLSHHWTSLAPMAEVALSLATTYASSKKLAIVGLYEAPELVSDRNASSQAIRLAEKIAAVANKDALILFVNNAALLSTDKNALLGFAVSSNAGSGGKGETKPKALQGSAVSLQDQAKAKELEAAVRRERAWEKLSDFDDHLENPSLDWLQNSAITA